MAELRKIVVEFIPNKDQRYPTVGDYFRTGDGTLLVRVSDTGWDFANLAIALHELVEESLCTARGISEPAIAAFDMEFEKRRPAANDDEPGDAADAPYRREHRFAENIERQFVQEHGVHWDDYEEMVRKVYETSDDDDGPQAR